MSARQIVPYIRRDDISWWAGCRYADQGQGEIYIAESACLTRLGATFKAKRMARKSRRLRDLSLDGFCVEVGEPR